MSLKSLLLSLTNAGLCLVPWVLIGIVLLRELSRDKEDGAARLFGMGQDARGAIHLMVAIALAPLALPRNDSIVGLPENSEQIP